MPSKNELRVDLNMSYYHVYARGNGRRRIFIEPSDYTYFLSLLKRYLSPIPNYDRAGTPYIKLHERLELLSFCLMPNHFHLFLYQISSGGIVRLMRGVMTAYSIYFNHKYDLSGHLYETRYKAALIDDDAYLQHITRYIHLNPPDWRVYPYSSLGSYLGRYQTDWLHPERILNLFSSPDDYLTFVATDAEVHGEAIAFQHAD